MEYLQIRWRTILILVALGILVCWFFFKGCSPTPSTVDRKSYDSLLVAKKESEKASEILIDSIFKENNRRVIKEQVLAKQLGIKDNQLSAQCAITVSLAQQVKLYEKYKDTTEQLRAAPLLADQVIILSEQLDDYKKTNSDLYASLDSTKQGVATILLQKDSLYKELNGQFNFLAGKYSVQDYKLAKTEKKANKRLVAGPQMMVTYLAGKPKICLGAGLTYILVRF